MCQSHVLSFFPGHRQGTLFWGVKRKSKRPGCSAVESEKFIYAGATRNRQICKIIKFPLKLSKIIMKNT